jgi:hypothetical protein
VTHSCAIHLFRGVAARPPPLVPQALLGGRPVVEFPLGCRPGAVEVCWYGHSRDCSGATQNEAPSSWISWRFGLTFYLFSSVVGFGVRLVRLCGFRCFDGFVNSKPGSFRAFRLKDIVVRKNNLPF